MKKLILLPLICALAVACGKKTVNDNTASVAASTVGTVITSPLPGGTTANSDCLSRGGQMVSATQCTIYDGSGTSWYGFSTGYQYFQTNLVVRTGDTLTINESGTLYGYIGSNSFNITAGTTKFQSNLADGWLVFAAKSSFSVSRIAITRCYDTANNVVYCN